MKYEDLIESNNQFFKRSNDQSINCVHNVFKQIDYLRFVFTFVKCKLQINCVHNVFKLIAMFAFTQNARISLSTDMFDHSRGGPIMNKFVTIRASVATERQINKISRHLLGRQCSYEFFIADMADVKSSVDSFT